MSSDQVQGRENIWNRHSWIGPGKSLIIPIDIVSYPCAHHSNPHVAGKGEWIHHSYFLDLMTDQTILQVNFTKFSTWLWTKGLIKRCFGANELSDNCMLINLFHVQLLILVFKIDLLASCNGGRGGGGQCLFAKAKSTRTNDYPSLPLQNQHTIINVPLSQRKAYELMPQILSWIQYVF